MIVAMSVLFVLIAAAGAGEGQHAEGGANHRFDDVDAWVKRFEDPSRDAWQRPDVVLSFLEVVDGSRVADIGAGTGYFAVRAARLVGARGHVWAIDVEPGMVEHLGKRAQDLALPQLEPVLTAPDDPGIPAGAADVVLIVNTWHHIEDRAVYLGKLRGRLRPAGRVAIVDYREGELPVGPPADHKLSRSQVLGEFVDAGWALAAESTDLPYQYVLVFRPKP